MAELPQQFESFAIENANLWCRTDMVLNYIKVFFRHLLHQSRSHTGRAGTDGTVKRYSDYADGVNKNVCQCL